MKTKYIRTAIIFMAVIFIVIGFTQGGFNDTLNKGIRICMECIGLG